MACSRHFWQETQSITREMLWKTPLNCFLRLHHGEICEALSRKSSVSSKASKTDEHDSRMCVSRKRCTREVVRRSSASSPEA